MIIADTGFMVALANAADEHHERADELLRSVKEPLISTWPVITETCHLILTRVGVRLQVAFVRGVRAGALELFPLQQDHLPRIEQLMIKYRDLPMDLADASLVVLAEAIGSGRILSTDRRDFRTYRWKNRRPFSNLLLPD